MLSCLIHGSALCFAAIEGGPVTVAKHGLRPEGRRPFLGTES